MNTEIHDLLPTVRSGSPSRSETKPRILVIDDDQSLCAVLCEALKTAGYDADGALDGQLGLKLFAENQYNLIISDMLMPNCDGVELIGAIRRQNPSASIIAISGGGLVQPEIYLRMAEVFGVKKILRKPFDMNSLIELVNSELGRS